MNSSEIPPSVKSPLSLKADYANPMLYGWASILVGILALFLVVPVLLMSASLLPVVAIAGLGALLLIVGVWMVKKGE